MKATEDNKKYLLRAIGNNLRIIRKRNGDEIKDTSSKTGYSTVAISNYELGKREMGFLFLVSFCKIYNVKYEEVLDVIVEGVTKEINYKQILLNREEENK